MTMMSRAVFVIVLALAAVQLTSCERKASFDPALAGAFFPLHPGSSWTYRVIDKNLGTTDIISDRVVDKQLINIVKTGGEAISGSVSGGASKSTILYVTEGGYINRVSVDGTTGFGSRRRSSSRNF